MWGARSGSARSRANGNTFWGNDLSRTVSFYLLHVDVRGDYGLISVARQFPRPRF